MAEHCVLLEDPKWGFAQKLSMVLDAHAAEMRLAVLPTGANNTKGSCA
jgi:hypothetical protein